MTRLKLPPATFTTAVYRLEQDGQYHPVLGSNDVGYARHWCRDQVFRDRRLVLLLVKPNGRRELIVGDMV